MNKVFKVLTVFSFVSIALISCNKKKEVIVDPVPEPTPIPSSETGNLNVTFKNVVDMQDLILNKSYLSPVGDTFTIKKFNYYVSNFSLVKEDNSVLTIPGVYQIVKHSEEASKTITLTKIPVGNYKSIQFMLGVDSASNCSGAHTGGLDWVYAGDMYWNWNSGYIFLKLEGTAPTSTNTSNGKGYIEYHIGGYGGTNKAQRIFNLAFGSEVVTVSSSSTPTVNMVTNANEMFKTPNLISFATNPLQTSAGQKAKVFADNYADMIHFGSIKK